MARNMHGLLSEVFEAGLFHDDVASGDLLRRQQRFPFICFAAAKMQLALARIFIQYRPIKIQLLNIVET